MLFDNLINSKNKNIPKSITSICSANKFVIKAAMLFEKNSENRLLIESTSNQVDQFGGYTGMTPSDFINYVKVIADEVKFPIERIVFGGDHLGPNVWQDESAKSAMQKAEEQIQAYISAGFRKIHLDTSFSLGDDDKSKPLATDIITERAARLCSVAEETYSKLNTISEKPVYVIGTEVPIPGGAQENDESLVVTNAEDLVETIELSKKAFYKRGLQDAWERVIAVVVQPGVEFSDTQVIDYNRKNASKIKDKIERYSNLLLEAHSTDYQTKEALTQMVEDHFGILKVGPWLTYAFREAIFALAKIEEELFSVKERSNIRSEIESAMVENPKYWKKHYRGTDREIAFARLFSYSDRIRYYWNNPIVQESVDKLLSNLENYQIPEMLIGQYLPIQYKELRNGKIDKSPEALIISKITEVISVYESTNFGN